jgi:aryl-alcohol dehydrogenase-like predicted oxidoreductase
MRYIPLGDSGLVVSELGYGAARLVRSSVSSTRESVATLREALDRGINLVDTADTYTFGISEVIVGQAIRGRRDAVVVATKGGYCRSLAGRIMRRGPKSPIAEQDFSTEHLRRAVEASLRRLRTDHIDLYQLHSPPRSACGGEWTNALDSLVRQGKIRLLGISVREASDVPTWLDQSGISVIQVPLSPANRWGQGSVAAVAAAAGQCVLARQPLASGHLLDNASALTLAAREIGLDEYGLALQLVRSLPGVSCTLVGMGTRDHLRRNVDVFSLDPLASDHAERLWSALESI